MKQLEPCHIDHIGTILHSAVWTVRFALRPCPAWGIPNFFHRLRTTWRREPTEPLGTAVCCWPQVFQRGGSGALWDDPLPSGSASPVVAPNQSVVERLVSPVVKRSWSNGDIQHELGSGNNFRSVEGNYLRDPIFIDTSIHIAIIQYIDPCINMLGLVVGRPLASLSQPPSSCQRYPIFSDIQSSAHFHAP